MIYCKDEDFEEWAFGKDKWAAFLDCEIGHIDLLDAWNGLHSDLQAFKPEDLVQPSIDAMKELYNKQKDFKCT